MKRVNGKMRMAVASAALTALTVGCGGGGGTSFIVNSVNDMYDGACNANHCSLREAIIIAITTPGVSTITFNIGGGGVRTIQPTSGLPAVTVPMVIDGTSQPGYVSSPLIELDGSLAGAGIHGLLITGGKTIVRGLAIGNFGGNGIQMEASGENKLDSNYIGTDVFGAAAKPNGGFGVRIESGDKNAVGLPGLGNVISGNLAGGVSIAGGLRHLVQGNIIGLDAGGTAELGNHGTGVDDRGQITVIGGETAPERNVISGNWGNGVRVGLGPTLVKGNYIGTDINGAADLGNHENGVRVSGTNDIEIGLGSPGGTNVISGNELAGILLDDGSADVNIFGNKIGTDRTGTAALGNIKAGIVVGGTDHTIGATWDGAERNIISGNGGSGIAIVESADRITVKNNYIGTDVSGTAALGNDLGIEVGNWIGDPDIDIGGAVIAANQANVISGNATDGILLYFGASVWGNKIGTDASGSNPLPNGGNGVLIKGSGNRVGGVNSGNTIAFNGGHGVAVRSESHNAVQNPIQVNNIHDNALLGIAIDQDAPLDSDPMDADSGDNNRQNHPDLMTAFSDMIAGTLTLVGKFSSAPNTEYAIEVFANPACDPSGHGEGYIMIDAYQLTTNADGYAVINDLLADEPTTPWGDYFTATATDPAGNTSDFSNCVSRTEQPVDVKVETETPLGMTYKPFLDPAGIFWGRCTPDTARISVEIVNPPEPVSYVLLFARLMNPQTGEKTEWSEGLSMLSGGKGIFFYDLSAYDMNDFNKFSSGVVQYQFVVYNKGQEVIGRSEVYADLGFGACGKPAGAVSTPTPKSPLVGPK